MRRIISLISNNPAIAVVLILSLIVALTLSLIANKPIHVPDKLIKAETPLLSPTPTILSYQGKSGKDALTLLKKHAMMGQNASGMVTIINGRKVDDKKHEYWALYVNGKLVSVEPAKYQTKDSDMIEWKIEKH